METKLHAIIPTICEIGEFAVPRGIMQAAERGAIRDDVRAARAGLIVPGITNAHGKREALLAPHYPGDDYKAINAARAAERENTRIINALARAMLREMMDE